MNNQKVLVIRFRQLGDAVLSSSLCTSIRKAIPNAEIHYVLNAHIAPAFQSHPDIDKVIAFDDEDQKNILRYMYKVWTLVRKEKYSIIIDTRATTRTMLFSLFSMGSKYRIGRIKSYNRIIHNYRIDNLPDGTKDTVTLTLKLLEPLKNEFNIQGDANFKLRISDEEKKIFQSKMEEKGINLLNPIIFCNVTTKLSFKSWDLAKMKEVLIQILDKYKEVQLIFNYGDDIEKVTAYNLYEEIESNSRIFINIEASNTKELIAMIGSCHFYFGNEGGARHIAQALDIPAFAIYAPNARKKIWLPSTSPKFQGIEAEDINPISAQNKELTHEEKFSLIEAEAVWKKLDEMLAGHIK